MGRVLLALGLFSLPFNFNLKHNHFFSQFVIGCSVNDYWLWKNNHDVMGNITGFCELEKNCVIERNYLPIKMVFFAKYIICLLSCSIKTEGKWFQDFKYC